MPLIEEKNAGADQLQLLSGLHSQSPHVQATVLVSISLSARQRWAEKGLCGVTGVAGRAGFDPTATDLFPVTSCLACCFQSAWSAACC